MMKTREKGGEVRGCWERDGKERLVEKDERFERWGFRSYTAAS